MLRDWIYRLRCLLRGSAIERELDDELRFHLEKHAEKFMCAGYSREESARLARLALAGPEQTKERCRDARGVRFWNVTVQDLRYGFRQLIHNPGFSIVAALVLGLGIGANTAIFSFLDAAMLKGLPVEKPEELVVPKWTAKSTPSPFGSSDFESCFESRIRQPEGGCTFSYPIFRLIQKRSDLFSNVTALAGPATVNGRSSGPASQLNIVIVDGQFFATLGVRPAIGRALRTEDDADGAQPAVVLSDGYWKSTFAGDSAAIGRIVRLNGEPFTVAGVADPRFNRLSPGYPVDLWLPLHAANRLGIDFLRRPLGDEHEWFLKLIARRKAGITQARIEAELTTLLQNEMIYRAKLLKPGSNPRIEVTSAHEALTGVRELLGEPLYILSAAVALILLIACTNVAGLLTARGAARQREIAIRLAVGAGRGRIIRQLVTESALLGALGAATGMFFAYGLVRALNALLPMQLDVRADLGVLSFTMSIVLLAVLLFGLAPALRSTRVQPLASLGSGLQQAMSSMARKLKLANVLVVSQVALATVMLFGAGLLVRTLISLKNVHTGLRVEQLLVFGVSPDSKRYTEVQLQTLYRTLREQLAGLPGVSMASYSSHPLLTGGISSTDVRIEGRSDLGEVHLQLIPVGADFVKTMGMTLMTGRNLRHADFTNAHPVALVNQAYTTKYLAGRSPLGLHYGSEKPEKGTEIVGMVNDARHVNLRDAVEPTAYLPLREGSAYFELRTARSALALAPEVRNIVRQLDDDLPVFNMRTQGQLVDDLLFVERMTTFLSSGFGILALLLTCIGLYGLLSYEVARRTREIGIRLAVGARPRAVQGSVLRETLGIVTLGLAVGIPVALLTTRALTAILYNVKAGDPLTLACAVLIMLFVAGLAAYIPSRRASRVDPMVALRYE